MAQQELYAFQANDVRAASDPDVSRANIISTVAIPALKRKTTSLSAGGAVGDVNFAMPQIEAPEPKFGTNGPDPAIFSGMAEADQWTFAGAFRKKNGVIVPAKAIIEGIITDWEPDEQTPGELMKCNHSFQEVTHYEFHLDGSELFYFDWYERALRFSGVSLISDINAALGI
ncbi:phage major tail tube protein [uncultured Cohaesibacter sp.]|uniref:phage major tail tube protein n=1 Tax=uncultured Cohaesibacter sp. TaxID=1002546 RepID=UPI0029C6F9A8|nr:phage major tail tube protein [uncultured Cohaesibacter sp.]